MWSSKGLGWSWNPVTGVLEDSHVKTEAEGECPVMLGTDIRVVALKAKTSEIFLTTIRSWGRGIEQILPQKPQKDSILLTHWFLDFLSP